MSHIRRVTTSRRSTFRIISQKPIYDIPDLEVLAGDLVGNLIKQFEPGFTLGERAETIEKQEDGTFIVTLIRELIHASVVAIGRFRFCQENHL
jgi:hypothetical protein